MTTVTYVTTYGATAAIGSIASRIYSANGLFDPDISGVGHQPMYFDQLMAIYDHYTVFRSRIKVEFVASGNTALVVLYIDDDTSIATSSEQAAEQVTAQHKVSLTTAARPTVFTRTWDAKEFFGGDIFDNDNLQGTAAANPTEQSYFILLWSALDTGVSAGGYINVTIEYDAVFDELKTQSQS